MREQPLLCKVNLHLTPEDVYIRSTWNRQASMIADRILDVSKISESIRLNKIKKAEASVRASKRYMQKLEIQYQREERARLAAERYEAMRFQRRYKNKIALAKNLILWATQEGATVDQIIRMITLPDKIIARFVSEISKICGSESYRDHCAIISAALGVK